MKLLLSAILGLTASTAVFGQVHRERERIYSVPDLHGRATLLIKPEIPGELASKEDGNTLTVRVFVDANGDVIEATCSMTCPRSAAGLAEAAAMASKFRPLLINGGAVKYEGILTYTIAVGRVDWFRFAGALRSAHVFDNLSLGTAAAMLTNEFASERRELENLDNRVELAVRWKTIEDVRDSIRGKLKGRAAWWFDLGLAMRDVTFPFQSDKKLDLDEVQAAISNLAKFVDSAPEGVPPATVEALRTLSNYKIDVTMPPQKVSTAISRLSVGIWP